MAKRVQQRAEPTTTKKKTEETAETPTPTEHKSPEELKAEMDELMDDIDEALEKNALDFNPAEYIQKGGE